MLNTVNCHISQPSIVGIFVLIFIIVNNLASSLNPVQETKCLACIRNVSSLMGIDTTKRCESYYCGQFQLSYTYWAEAGKPGNNQGSRDYEKCARDKSCAEQAVRSYFKKFKRDCNNDGLIDCLDMAALHKGGPASCASDWFYKSRYWLAFNKTSCMTNRDLEISKSDFGEQSNQPVRMMKNQTLTSECLDCICDAISGCNTGVNNCASGTVCGPFAISQAFWKDGRKPGASWTACARTKECSSVTMKNYMEKYKKDCNGDGFITCEDYAAIHRRGPRACSNKDLLKDHYWNKFLACRANQKPIKDVNMVKVSNSIDDPETQSPLASQGDTLMVSSTAPPILEAAQNSLDQSGGGLSSATILHGTSTSSSSSSSGGRFDYSPTPTYELTSIMNAREDLPTRKSSTKASLDRSQNVPYPASVQVQIFELNKHKPDEDQANLKPKPNSNYRPSPAASTNYESTGDSSDFQFQPNPALSAAVSASSGGRPMVSLPAEVTATQISTTVGTTTTSSSYFSTNLPPQAQTVATRQSPQHESHILHKNRNEAPNKLHHVVTSQKVDQQPVAQSLSFPPVDQLTQQQPNYGDKMEFPYSTQENPNGSGRQNFDDVVIGIVGNPDFPKSYPPVPEFVAQEKQTDPVHEPPLTSKSQQRITTNHSRNPNQPGKVPPLSQTNQSHSSSDSSLSQKAINRGPVSESPLSNAQRSTVNQQQQKNHEIDTSSIIPPMFGAESLNMSGLVGLGLNESSRIASECLECICDASSNCDTTVQCISKQREKNRCGLYMISWNQYQESDISLTSLVPVSDGMSEETTDEKMYYECTTDKVCAEKLIHLYIEKHQKDCNNDGKIDCYDIAALHRVGPDNCNSGKFLSSQYWRDFNICYTTDRLATTTQPQPSSQLNL